MITKPTAKQVQEHLQDYLIDLPHEACEALALFIYRAGGSMAALPHLKRDLKPLKALLNGVRSLRSTWEGVPAPQRSQLNVWYGDPLCEEGRAADVGTDVATMVERLSFAVETLELAAAKETEIQHRLIRLTDFVVLWSVAEEACADMDRDDRCITASEVLTLAGMRMPPASTNRYLLREDEPLTGSNASARGAGVSLGALALAFESPGPEEWTPAHSAREQSMVFFLSRHSDSSEGG